MKNTANRLEKALTEIKNTEWRHFEKFASSFLSDDYPNLRTTASSSGDLGRDAELFSTDGKPNIVFQYSVTIDWNAKIKKTIERLRENFTNVFMLIYVTSQEIGANGDKIKSDMLDKFQIVVDIRDRNWFIERCLANKFRIDVSEHLYDAVIQTASMNEKIIMSSSQVFDNVESRAALVFLEMQLHDDSREKGLTRVSFEALTRAALRGTDSGNRLSRQSLYDKVCLMLPAQDKLSVSKHVDSAVNKLSKRVIKHWKADDTFCLSSDENSRINNNLLEISVSDRKLHEEIKSLLVKSLPASDGVYSIIISRVKRLIESFLLARGEVFASAVNQDVQYSINKEEDIEKFIINDISNNKLSLEEISLTKNKVIKESYVKFISVFIVEVLKNSGEELRTHLRRMANSYTVMAFLRQTPDVQSAVKKMFSHGDIWVDTGIMLFLIAESLSDEELQFTLMIKTAIKAGVNFFVTQGVVQEIERHLNRCLTYTNMSHSQWEGNIPFLYSAYIRNGNDKNRFSRWVENFKGNARPLDDLIAYFRDEHDIIVYDLHEEADKVPQDLRFIVKEVWTKIHENRRAKNNQFSDNLSLIKLADHDTENYLGVMGRQNRPEERETSMGYISWWLTLDRAAFSLYNEVKGIRTGPRFVVTSPVMSPDFMVNYLTLGPGRTKISKEQESILPVLLELRINDDLTDDLLRIAERVRDEYKDLPERTIQRKVRDKLDEERKRLGQIGISGASAIENEVLNSLHKE